MLHIRPSIQLQFAILNLALLFAGCGKTTDQLQQTPTEGRFTIVTTTGMVTDLVRQIAGEHANTIGIMGEGVDPHLFKPTSSDNAKLMSADLVVYSGLLLEGQMQTSFENARKRGKQVAAVTDSLPKEKIRHPEGFSGHPDPHIWGDVSTWLLCLDHALEILCEFDPKHAAEYRTNAQAYREQLLKVDNYARESIASIPEQRRYLITAHDAFEYFATAYRLEVKSVQGISTESEPGVQDINELVDFLVENKIPAIFVEATVNSANIQAVIEGAQQQGWNVHNGGTLFSDSLGAPGTYEGTYIGMMDHNITTITKALGGIVPEAGLNGKLKTDKSKD